MSDVWKPNPGPQTKALQSIAFETLYGGARGGGKTDAGLVWILKEVENPNYRGLVIRRNADDLSDWVDRATKLYNKYGATIAYRPAIIKFPSGAIIRTGHLKDDQAYTKYQGHEYQRMLIEELTQIPDEKRYLQLIASCRSTDKTLPARIFATTNPGGVGHGWVKTRFIDIGEWGKYYQEPEGRTRIFVHAKVEDTPQLVDNDPGYVKFLDSLKNTDVELWKAWRLGDWDTFAGQFFREFRRDLHVIPPFRPRNDVVVVGGLDWGRTDPFCYLSSVVFTVKYTGLDKTNPDSKEEQDYTFTRVFTFQEAYGTDRLPREWAERINQIRDIGTVQHIQADNQIFNKADTDHSTSIAQQFYDFDPRFYGKLKAASKERVTGWEAMHQWLSLAPDGSPYWLITENCINLIRTLPELVHDDIKVEDVDQVGEDHAPDAARYMLKAIRWVDAKLGGVKPIQPLVPASSRYVKMDKPIDISVFHE